MTAVLTELIGLIVGGLSAMATGIGGGLNDLVTNIFIEGTGDSQKLTVFGGTIGIFAGISLAIGLSRWVVNFVASLGARNR